MQRTNDGSDADGTIIDPGSQRSTFVVRWTRDKQAAEVPLVLPTGKSPCPFCPEQIGREVDLQTGEAVDAQWECVVLGNLFPITALAEDHELIIPTREHGVHFGDMDDEVAGNAWRVVKERLKFHENKGRGVCAWVNYGVAAGSSQPHPHLQLVASVNPVTAQQVIEELACPACAVGEETLVGEGVGYQVYVAAWPMFEDELIVVAGEHDGELDEEGLAAGVKLAINAVWGLRGAVPYNVILHHWEHPHAHVIPRTYVFGGLEMVGFGWLKQSPAVRAEMLRVSLSEKVSG